MYNRGRSSVVHRQGPACFRGSKKHEHRRERCASEVELLPDKGANRLVVLFALVAVHFLPDGDSASVSSATAGDREMDVRRRQCWHRIPGSALPSWGRDV